MQLKHGHKLGSFEIIRLLGKGGMGEVYEARDVRLDRAVAIKVLPAELSGDAERRDRFKREAKAVASLNHSHICTLHDVGDHDGIHFLVMELIEGETLAERLERGALPLDQALRSATEMADALDKAHRKGIVHRDLKPGNVMLTKAGVKLLDFGLAKLTQSGAEGHSPLSELPTQQKALTADGAIIGTFQYMAPEQLEGKEVDTRTDVFAFGVTLYEMLAGKRPFEGKSAASLIAAIIEREPRPLKEIDDATPAALSQLIEGCLAKDPEDRWQSMADVTRQLRWIETGPDIDATSKQTQKMSVLPYALLTGAAVIVAALAGLWIGRSDEVPRSPSRFVIPFPAGDEPSTAERSIALSPDGTLLVYAAIRDGMSRLFVRPLDRLDATPIPGTEGARGPFFSPDGKWVAFFTGNQLKKVNLEGGPPIAIADAILSQGGGGIWSPLGEILFSTGIGSGLLRVSETGGVAEVLTTPEKDEGKHDNPHILPDNQHVLFTVGVGGESMRVALLSLETQEWKALDLGNVPHATFAPSGHLVFARPGGLYAAPFDVEKRALTGPPVPVLQNVAIDFGSGSAHYSISKNGTLAFVPSRAENRLVWVNRRGDSRPLLEEPRMYLTPRLSPDGRRLAVVVRDVSSGRRDIWVKDLTRDTFTRLTQPNLEFAHEPAWSPDGTQIAFAGRKLGSDLNQNVFVAFVDGTGEPRRLTANAVTTVPTSWSRDGNLIFFQQQSDVGVLRVDEPESEKMLLDSPPNEIEATLSPNGRWLAYTSNESGRYEVYVTDFPALDQRWQISVNGGKEALWAANGRELFYRSGDRMMVVQITSGSGFTPSKPAILFEGPYAVDPVGQDAVNYDVTADGQEFVMVEEDRLAPGVVVVLNWTEELKRLVPIE